MKNYYEILKVEFDCDLEEIKSSYKNLIKIYHPDVNPSKEAITLSLDINEAYSILSNEQKRNKYDIELFWKLDLGEIIFTKKTLKRFSKDELIKLYKRIEDDFNGSMSKNELIELILEGMEEIKDYTSDNITVKELKEEYTKNDLMDLCDDYNIEYKTNMTKYELIEIIKPNLKRINSSEKIDNDYYSSNYEGYDSFGEGDASKIFSILGWVAFVIFLGLAIILPIALT